jgi:hypothetical protein
VFRTRHPEITDAVNETLELVRAADVRIEEAILRKLGVSA